MNTSLLANTHVAQVQVPGFQSRPGDHCETTSTRSLLATAGLDLSEPMAFGLGEALQFIYWDMKKFPRPFIGGRSRPFELTKRLCDNLNIRLIEYRTDSPRKAWQQASSLLESGKPVGLQLDCYHLNYFSEKAHFRGHFVAMYGFDKNNAFLVDTKQQGSEICTPLRSLQAAREDRGPMYGKHLCYAIDHIPENISHRHACYTALRRNAYTFLNPSIRNVGVKGIAKFAELIHTWAERCPCPAEDFAITAMLMEKAGTGGSIFRNLFSDFLEEVAGFWPHPLLSTAEQHYRQAALLWHEVANELENAAIDSSPAALSCISNLIKEIHQLESTAMSRLYELPRL